ncbi:3-isopropylmalate dehydratase small subunit [Caenispirillum bisanense]|uniref:3-isopropylmalate dehydratase n=1 Tax=Caenispirillum bisanense TaxID=414052 RepID=A0A286GCV9_9PROT|nr:3-isopropylmalate dehydratase small subunit [Caenispirillum bisanense]SOD93340.1 3-isopropylmalate/(R)-2-methylmalate dehydratase small subunit [Caenispirillum bisanense]
MTPFVRETGRAVVLPVDNVDTDQIIPARFLRKPRGGDAGYGDYLLHDLRRDADGAPKPDFPLNAPGPAPLVLVAGDNFGCGSSREGAVYALVDAGIRVVVSTRIADIFRNNAVRNGLVPVELSAADHAALTDVLAREPDAAVTVDLEQGVLTAGALRLPVALDAGSRRRLLCGLDDIGETEARLAEIDQAERRYTVRRPWTAVSGGR